MSDTLNYGKLKIGVDWEDKGWVSFNQETQLGGDDLNLITDSKFFDTQLGHDVAGNVTAKVKVIPEGLYGLEKVTLDFTDTGFYTLGDIIFDGRTIPVEGTQEYSLWLYYKSYNNYTNDVGHVFSFLVEEFDVVTGGTVVQTTTTTPDLTVGTGAMRVHFTTDSTTNYVTFTLLKSDTDHAPLTFDLLGVMLLTGDVSSVPNWNGGYAIPDTVVDNDITSFSTQVQGSLGKTSWETILFDEGSLTVTLDNDDKRFSPENADSPLYGYMKPYLRLWVAIEDSLGELTLLWSGWTHQFGLTTGIYNSRQATLTGRQGRYAIEAQDPTLLVATENQYSDTAIRAIMSEGYEISGQNGSQPVYNIIIHNLNFGSSNYGVQIPVFGVSFVETDNPSFIQTLQDISELNGGFIFLDREGKIVYRTFEEIVAASPATLDYGLTNSMDYNYSPIDLYKAITITYQVYANASDIEMQGQDQTIYIGASDFPFDIRPQYNGLPLIGNVILDVSAFLPLDYNASPAFGTANAAFTEHDQGIYTWYSALSNNTTDIDYRLSLVSRDSGSVWYAVETNKKYTVTNSLDRALPTLTYNNPLITSDDMAHNFVAMQQARRGAILSWFTSAHIINKNAAAVDFIVNYSVGDVLSSQEEQSGNIPKALVIIGENFTYTPGYLQMQYSFAPAFNSSNIILTPCAGISDFSVDPRNWNIFTVDSVPHSVYSSGGFNSVPVSGDTQDTIYLTCTNLVMDNLELTYSSDNAIGLQIEIYDETFSTLLYTLYSSPGASSGTDVVISLSGLGVDLTGTSNAQIFISGSVGGVDTINIKFTKVVIS